MLETFPHARYLAVNSEKYRLPIEIAWLIDFERSILSSRKDTRALSFAESLTDKLREFCWLVNTWVRWLNDHLSSVYTDFPRFVAFVYGWLRSDNYETATKHRIDLERCPILNEERVHSRYYIGIEMLRFPCLATFRCCVFNSTLTDRQSPCYVSVNFCTSDRVLVSQCSVYRGR